MLINRNAVFALSSAALAFVLAHTAGAQQADGPDAARNAFPVPASVRVVRDVVYASYGERRLKLDLYLPPAPGTGVVSGILVVRGGGWLSGDKEAFGFIAGSLAKEGFVAASIEYRTSNEATFPAAAYDVKAAVRWLRAHAKTYGVNPDAIGAIGGSAGGHLVALLATSAQARDLEGNGGSSGISSEVQAVVAMACVCNLELQLQRGDATVRKFIGEPVEAHRDAVKAASPVTYVSGRSAPLLLLQSRTDPVVPFDQSLEMEAAYRRAGAPVVLTQIDAPRTHAFWNETKFFLETMHAAVEFFRRNLAQR